MLPRIVTILLAALPLTMLGCPETAPDPCSSDADCDQCQICSSGSCVPDPQPSCEPAATLVTIQGNVSMPNANVEVEHAGTTVSAVADGNGDFSIEIPEPASTDLLLRARHASESSFELVSLLPDSTALVTLAGSDGVLSQDEHPGTRITPLSTVVYATMKAGFGRAPQTTAEKAEAERTMRSLRDGAEIVRLAAALKLIIEDSTYSLPAGTASTVALAEDILGARAVLEGLAARSDGDPTAALVEAMLSDPMVVTPYVADRKPVGYLDLTLRRNGVVGYSLDRWELDSNGSGVAQIGYRNWLDGLHPLSWAVAAAGELELSYVAPPTSYRYFTVEEIASLYTDNAELQNTIRTALTEGFQAPRVVSMQRFIRLWAGQAVELLKSQERVVYELSAMLASRGVTAPDVEVTEDGWAKLLLRDDALPRLPWTDTLTSGTRLMQVVAPSDLQDAWNEDNSGDPVAAAALVEFVDTTTAVATGGASSTPLTIDYEILADGRLQLTYPTGEIQTVAILVQQDNELGLLSTYVSSTDGTYAFYDRSVRVSPGFGLSTAQLVNSTDQYWQNTINDYAYLLTSGGELSLDRVFGFYFASNGLLDRLWVDYVDPDTWTDPYVYRDETWTFQVDQGVLHMLGFADRDGPSRCDSTTEPSCYLYHERVWQPLAQHGDLAYVLETDRMSVAIWYYHWDDAQQSWVDDSGSPADPEAVYGWYFLPRINAYHVDDVPTL